MTFRLGETPYAAASVLWRGLHGSGSAEVRGRIDVQFNRVERKVDQIIDLHLPPKPPSDAR